MKYTGALVGTMSGSMGGATASHNRGGQYLRQRVVPTNPASSRQVQIRNYLGGSNFSYSMLNNTKKQSWADYAANVPTTDSLGNTIYLTGMQMFTRSYVTAMLAGTATTAMGGPTIYDRGPSVVAFDPTGSGTTGQLEIASDAMVMEVTLASTPGDGGTLLMFIGKPVSANTNFYKGPYQFAGIKSSIILQTTAITNVVSELTIDAPLEDLQYRPVRLVYLSLDFRVSQEWTQILRVTDTTP